MKIAYKQGDDGGCFHYRQHLPHQALHKHGGAECACVRLGTDIAEASHIYRSSDIAVFPRLVGENSEEVVKFLQARGKKVVIDYDDDFFNVNPLSAHYREGGTEEVTIDKNGKVEYLWQDGVNGFSIARNKREMEYAIKAIRLADAITVTTPVLAKVFEQYNANVYAIPNMIDPARWNKLPLKRKGEEIRIGWQGGASHYTDWCLLTDVLPTIMRNNPQVTLVIAGQAFDGLLNKLPQDRIERHGWIETAAHPLRSAVLDLDIALIPLVDSQFNRCKSNIKWVEAAALEVPSVTSAVTPYVEFATEHNGVFVENNTASWVAGIQLLIDDPLLRAKMGYTAYQTMQALFDINRGYTLWQDAYEDILGKERIAA